MAAHISVLLRDTQIRTFEGVEVAGNKTDLNPRSTRMYLQVCLRFKLPLRHLHHEAGSNYYARIQEAFRSFLRGTRTLRVNRFERVFLFFFFTHGKPAGLSIHTFNKKLTRAGSRGNNTPRSLLWRKSSCSLVLWSCFSVTPVHCPLPQLLRAVCTSGRTLPGSRWAPRTVFGRDASPPITGRSSSQDSLCRGSVKCVCARNALAEYREKAAWRAGVIPWG